MEELIKTLRANLEKTAESLKKEFQRVRTGRANLALLDPVRVEYYGAKLPLNQVAVVSLSETDPRLIMVKPWEKSMLAEIEKAIHIADLGLTPQNDGEKIRLSLPPLSEERRRELVKQCHKMAEGAKVAVRNHRRDANEAVKKMEKNKELTEDERKKALDRIQKETDAAIARVDQILAEKEKEIMTI
jgi:ribosome recycling factor